MAEPRVFLAGGARTPIGNFGGALAASSAAELGAVAARAAHRALAACRRGASTRSWSAMRGRPGTVPTSRGRSAAAPGSPTACPRSRSTRRARRECRSIVSATQTIRLGDSQVVARGRHRAHVEHAVPGARLALGQEARRRAARRRDVPRRLPVPAVQPAHGRDERDPGVPTTRSRAQEQDSYALASNQRAARAWDEGRFASEVVPVTVGEGKRATTVRTDEHYRADASLEEMAKLEPGVQEGRHDHRRQRVGHHRRRGARSWCCRRPRRSGTASRRRPRCSGYASVGRRPCAHGDLGPVPAVRSCSRKHKHRRSTRSTSSS